MFFWGGVDLKNDAKIFIMSMVWPQFLILLNDICVQIAVMHNLGWYINTQENTTRM